ncbi:MAG: ParB/RepB/Spo0J family partition protein [Acidobacteria bacterium]|nr:ParB/RepB/Spo0J family partition protein [Acidobacteriota bacterium]
MKIVPLSRIEPDPDQPRRRLEGLEELTASIRTKGVLEPILARPLPQAGPDDFGRQRYRIISGERRFRAAQRAGIREIPLIEMDVSRSEALEIALVENLQRVDLTPFEEAEGLNALVERHGYTHEQIAAAVGRSRVSVTESLALLRLPRTVRERAVALGVSARKSILLEVLRLSSESEMLEMLERIAEFDLKRAQVRDEVRERRTAGPPDERPTESPEPMDEDARGPKPHVFRFQAPDERYSVSLTFRQRVVEETDLIAALEQVLAALRRERDRTPIL